MGALSKDPTVCLTRARQATTVSYPAPFAGTYPPLKFKFHYFDYCHTYFGQFSSCKNGPTRFGTIKVSNSGHTHIGLHWYRRACLCLLSFCLFSIFLLARFKKNLCCYSVYSVIVKV